MLQSFQDISITFNVLGFTSPLTITHPSTMYNVAFQSKGKTLFGINHKGTTSNWNDAFAIKLSSYTQNEVQFTIFANDVELGRTKLELLQIYQAVYPQTRKEYLMCNEEKNTGYIDIKIVKSSKLQIFGGLPIPRLSFRADHIQNNQNFVPIPASRLVQESASEVENLNINRRRKNLFSCLDDNTKQAQIMPNSLQVRKNDKNSFLE